MLEKYMASDRYRKVFDLVKSQGEMKAKEVADEFELDRTTATRSLKFLQRANLLEKRLETENKTTVAYYSVSEIGEEFDSKITELRRLMFSGEVNE